MNDDDDDDEGIFSQAPRKKYDPLKTVEMGVARVDTFGVCFRISGHGTGENRSSPWLGGTSGGLKR